MKKPLKTLLGKSLPTEYSYHFFYCEMPYSELMATVLVLRDRTQGFLTILIIVPFFFLFIRDSTGSDCQNLILVYFYAFQLEWKKNLDNRKNTSESSFKVFRIGNVFYSEFIQCITQ